MKKKLCIINKSCIGIGGNAFELRYSDFKILLDAGVSLTQLGIHGIVRLWDFLGYSVEVAIEKLQVIPNLKRELYDHRCGGIFLSHPHINHYGALFSMYHPQDIYCSQLCKMTLELYKMPLRRSKFYRHYAKTRHRYHTIKPETQIDVGDFSVTPLLVDHSAEESVAFFINVANAVNVLYTGDFRGLRSQQTLETLIGRYGDIHLVITEGTRVGDPSVKKIKEEDIPVKIKEILEKQPRNKFTVVSVTPTNIQRVCNIIRVCIDLNKQPFLLPDIHRTLVTRFWNYLESYLEDKCLPLKMFRSFKQISKAGYALGDIVIITGYFDSLASEKFLRKKTLEKTLHFFLFTIDVESKPYYEKLLKPIIKLCHKAKAGFDIIHAPGHIYEDELFSFLEKLQPRVIIPTHTERPDLVKARFPKSTSIIKREEIYRYG